MQATDKPDLNEIFERVSRCKAAVKNLERKVLTDLLCDFVTLMLSTHVVVSFIYVYTLRLLSTNADKSVLFIHLTSSYIVE